MMKFSGFNDIMKFAIQREEEAARGYGQLLEMATDGAARKLLQDLQQEEENHKRVLQGLTKTKIAADATRDVQDLKISDYLIDVPIGPGMSFQDLLIFSAKKEKKAAELYADLARKTIQKERKKLFEFLAKQEKSHKLRLELEYDKYILSED